MINYIITTKNHDPEVLYDLVAGTFFKLSPDGKTYVLPSDSSSTCGIMDVLIVEEGFKRGKLHASNTVYPYQVEMTLTQSD